MTNLYLDLANRLASTGTPASTATRHLILKAFAVAAAAHETQTRDNGEPYIIHPLRVATSLAQEMNITDVASICVALLHDTFEDQDVIDDVFIGQEFSPDIAVQIRALTKPSLDGLSPDEVNRIYFQRLAELSSDIQVIKLADKLDNVRDAVNSPNADKRARTLNEARDYYLPLALALTDASRRQTIAELLSRAIVLSQP